MIRSRHERGRRDFEQLLTLTTKYRDEYSAVCDLSTGEGKVKRLTVVEVHQTAVPTKDKIKVQRQAKTVRSRTKKDVHVPPPPTWTDGKHGRNKHRRYRPVRTRTTHGTTVPVLETSHDRLQHRFVRASVRRRLSHPNIIAARASLLANAERADHALLTIAPKTATAWDPQHFRRHRAFAGDGRHAAAAGSRSGRFAAGGGHENRKRTRPRPRIVVETPYLVPPRHLSRERGKRGQFVLWQ